MRMGTGPQVTPLLDERENTSPGESLPLDLGVAPLNDPAGLDLSPSLVALQAALEAIAAPAFLIGPRGEIVYANAEGRAHYDRDRKGTRRTLADAAACAAGGAQWALAALRGDGGSRRLLAILRAPFPETSIDDRVATASLRWKLTGRQREVLILVARGLTNAAIAEALVIGESTVEFHLKALFDKAGTHNRTALLASLLEG